MRDLKAVGEEYRMRAKGREGGDCATTSLVKKKQKVRRISPGNTGRTATEYSS